MNYHYIIAGAGASGLSLVIRMIDAGLHHQKRILIIDKDDKKQNDRTWCFWEKEADRFEDIVCKQWTTFNFYAENELLELDINPYTYKMIRGIDFYNYCKKIINQTPNVDWIKADIQHMGTIGLQTIVKTKSKTFVADYLFSSLFSRDNLPLKPTQYMLLQHFKGYIIETKTPCFDPQKATFMDFRVPQTHGTTFVYVLPFSSSRALVEYTLFTEKLLDKAAYDAALKDYIHNYLNIKNYDIIETEFGIIPMTDYAFPKQKGRIINIGTAGGFTKASSGFTFKNIQNNTEKIVKQLKSGQLPTEMDLKTPWRFQKYDATLLNILANKKLGGKAIFERMFTTSSPSTILSFLDNTSTVFEEMKMFSKLPIGVFMKAAMRELIKR